MSSKKRRSRVGDFLKEEPAQKLNITSMMDMFTIILLFLLMSFSTSPELVNQSDELILPASTQVDPPEASTSITVSTAAILVNDEVIVEVDEKSWTVPMKTLMNAGRGIAPLHQALQAAFEKGKKWEKASGRPFIPELLIKAHKDMDYTLLQKVLHSGATAGFSGYRLLVMQSS